MGAGAFGELFQIHNDPRARDQLAYHMIRVVLELHQLMKNSDYDETLIRYLCHPHSAWPQYPDPVDLYLVRAFGGKEEALTYLTDQYGWFWPVAPAKASRSKTGSVKDFSFPLGSAFAAVSGRGPRSNPSSQSSYWKRMLEYNIDWGIPEAAYAGDPPSPAEVSAMVREMVKETCSVAIAFVRSGAKFADDEAMPFYNIDWGIPEAAYAGDPPSPAEVSAMVREMVKETCSVAIAFVRSGAKFADDEAMPGFTGFQLRERSIFGPAKNPFRFGVSPQLEGLARIMSVDSPEDEEEKEDSDEDQSDDLSEEDRNNDAADRDSRDSSSA
ncbi:unnamed protein product [Aphanomyces euteiches]